LEPLFLAFLGHLVGDYLFQTDWMADNKKSQVLPCLIHSMIWAGCVVLFAGWGWIPFAILFALHFIQDHTYIVRKWMHLIGQDRFASGPYAPWSMVFIDNTFHLLQIWLIWKFVI
jgi:hypothetical protein